MLATSTRTDGSPLVSVFMAFVNWVRNVATEVMLPTDEVHRSLPPIKTVTYWTRCPTAFCIWPLRSAIFVPLAASL